MLSISSAFKKDSILFLLYFLLISYLLINTGIFSDDFGAMSLTKGKSLKEVLIPRGNFYFIDTPLEHFTHYIWYPFFSIDNLLAPNILKILYIILCFYFIAQFFKIYLDKYTALLASFLFIFFPSHDSSVYQFMLQYLTISFGLYFYSFYLAYRNRLALAFLSALAASFISYGSTPIALSLFVLFILNKQFKKGAVIIIPNIIYSIYVIFLTQVFHLGHSRIIEKLSILAVAKQFALQILTFLDSALGPSMWLKIYYSFSQLSMPSIMIGVLLTILFYRKYQAEYRRYDMKFVWSSLVLILLSFAMFSVTGRYPQLAFNLGNRVTIYSSLLAAYIIALVSLPKKIKTIIFAALIFTILGVSDHWKDWSMHQQKVAAAIRSNHSLKGYSDTRAIYVSGNQYSRYGPISHIEFFSEDWVVNPVFNLALGRDISVKALNKRHVYADGYLMDKKYGTKDNVSGHVNIYDSEKDILFKLEPGRINKYIESLPQDRRHWIQAFSNIEFIKDIAVKLMPRLKYGL